MSTLQMSVIYRPTLVDDVESHLIKLHLSAVSHQMLVDVIKSGPPQQYHDALKMHLQVRLYRINNEQ